MPIQQDKEAAAAIRAHHDELRDTLRARVGDLSLLEAGGSTSEGATPLLTTASSTFAPSRRSAATP